MNNQQTEIKISPVYPINHDDGTTDTHYSILPEYVGTAKPQYVLRHEGEFIYSSVKITETIVKALAHKLTRAME